MSRASLSPFSINSRILRCPFAVFTVASFTSSKDFFWSAQGLSRKNRGAPSSTFEMVSLAKFHERGFGILVNTKAMLVARFLGKRVDKVVSA